MDFIDFLNMGYVLKAYDIIGSYQVIFLIAIVLYAINFTFEAIGLNTIAKKAKSPHAWMAFLPFFNTNLIGELGGDGYLFSAKIKNSGLWAALMEIVAFVAGGLYMTMIYLLDPYYEPTTGTHINVPKTLEWAVSSIDYVNIALNLLEVGYILFLFVILFSFFRKYYYKSPMIMTISCYFFPFVKGIILFSVRNNLPFDYEAYARRQREEAMRRYQQRYQNPYDDPYRYSRPQNPYETGEKKDVPPDPFEEFASPTEKKAQKTDHDPDEFFN